MTQKTFTTSSNIEVRLLNGKPLKPLTSNSKACKIGSGHQGKQEDGRNSGKSDNRKRQPRSLYRAVKQRKPVKRPLDSTAREALKDLITVCNNECQSAHRLKKGKVILYYRKWKRKSVDTQRLQNTLLSRITSAYHAFLDWYVDDRGGGVSTPGRAIASGPPPLKSPNPEPIYSNDLGIIEVNSLEPYTYRAPHLGKRSWDYPLLPEENKNSPANLYPGRMTVAQIKKLPTKEISHDEHWELLKSTYFEPTNRYPISPLSRFLPGEIGHDRQYRYVEKAKQPGREHFHRRNDGWHACYCAQGPE